MNMYSNNANLRPRNEPYTRTRTDHMVLHLHADCRKCSRRVRLSRCFLPSSRSFFLLIPPPETPTQKGSLPRCPVRQAVRATRPGRAPFHPGRSQPTGRFPSLYPSLNALTSGMGVPATCTRSSSSPTSPCVQTMALLWDPRGGPPVLHFFPHPCCLLFL